MKKKELEEIYEVRDIRFKEIFTRVNSFFSTEKSSLVKLFIPFCILTVLSTYLGQAQGRMARGMGLILMIISQFVSLFITAFFLLSLDDLQGPFVSKDKISRTFAKIWSQFVTLLAMMVKMFPFILVIVAAAGGISMLTGSLYYNSVTTIISVIAIIAIFVFVVRYFLSAAISVLSEHEGFSAVNLSLLIVDKNYGQILFLLGAFMAVFIGYGLLISLGAFNMVIIYILPILITPISFYFMMVQYFLVKDSFAKKAEPIVEEA
ncbi:MAG: hypothetical protein PQJ59_05575 [Spirochaetales bacterium]|nr:hypothetical protein [Spirochaetales bacterium]